MVIDESEIRRRMEDNVAGVRAKIEEAAARSGRAAEQVVLIGVTKYVETPLARMLVESGVEHLGESRPQELWRKAEALAGANVHWHLIGHLQRNKVKRTVPLATCIHSVDSLRLLQEIDSAWEHSPPRDVLLEVNVSGDEAKHGLAPRDVEPLFPEIFKRQNVFVRGLMTMAGLESGPEQARREFAALRELSERLKPKCAHNIQMNELSMGMSGDYEIAIEEGATMVRIGSLLFDDLG